jgi:protein phosphatase
VRPHRSNVRLSLTGRDEQQVSVIKHVLENSRSSCLDFLDFAMTTDAFVVNLDGFDFTLADVAERRAFVRPLDVIVAFETILNALDYLWHHFQMTLARFPREFVAFRASPDAPFPVLRHTDAALLNLTDIVQTEGMAEEQVLRALAEAFSFYHDLFLTPSDRFSFTALLHEIASGKHISFRDVINRLITVEVDAEHAFLTDVGRVRTGNEDSLGIETTMTTGLDAEDTVLFAVADGMGGHQAGEVASSLAISGLIARYKERHDAVAAGQIPPGEFLGDAIRACHQTILGASTSDGRYFGMGTTLTGALMFLKPTDHGFGTAWAFNVGDSRLYLFAGDRLHRISKDHSLVQEMVDAGALSEEQAFFHPQKNVITMCLGGGEKIVLPDVITFPVGPDEIYIACSDGLSDMLTDEEIEAIAREHQEPWPLVDALVAAANERGGHDNITVVAISIRVER